MSHQRLPLPLPLIGAHGTCFIRLRSIFSASPRSRAQLSGSVAKSTCCCNDTTRAARGFLTLLHAAGPTGASLTGGVRYKIGPIQRATIAAAPPPSPPNPFHGVSAAAAAVVQQFISTAAIISSIAYHRRARWSTFACYQRASPGQVFDLNSTFANISLPMRQTASQADLPVDNEMESLSPSTRSIILSEFPQVRSLIR